MNPLCDSNTVKNVYTNTGAYSSSVNHPDLLSNITSATGEQTEVSYLTTPLYKDENNALYNPNLPLVINTVRHIRKNDGFGNPVHDHLLIQQWRILFRRSAASKICGLCDDDKNGFGG